MPEAMLLESLLLTRDPAVVRVLRPALDKLGVRVEVCTGAEAGAEILAAKKFDAVIIDCDDLKGGMEALQQVHKGNTNKSSIMFAVLNGSPISAAFAGGASFVLQKPISMANALRCFSAAHGAMLRERRRFFRVPIEIPVTIHFGQGSEFRVMTCNLSEGGMAIRTATPMPASGISRVRFTLPGTGAVIEPKSELAWSDGAGKAGIRFRDLQQSAREQLELWVAQQLEIADAGKRHAPAHVQPK